MKKTLFAMTAVLMIAGVSVQAGLVGLPAGEGRMVFVDPARILTIVAGNAYQPGAHRVEAVAFDRALPGGIAGGGGLVALEAMAGPGQSVVLEETHGGGVLLFVVDGDPSSISERLQGLAPSLQLKTPSPAAVAAPKISPNKP